MKKLENVRFLLMRIIKNMWKQRLKVFSLFILFAPIICFYGVAKCENKLSVFFDFWSNAIFQLVITSLASSVVIAIIKFVAKKRAYSYVIIFAFIIITTFSVSGILKIQSIHFEKSESSNNNNNSNNNDNNADMHESDNVEKYTKIPYVFEDDPFFTEKKEEYFGIKKGSLTEKDEMVEYMANVIYEDMQSTKIKDKNISELYENYTQAAELLYQTYTYQRDRDWSKKDTYAVVVSKNCRIEILIKAKDERINGDNEYQDCENRRIISIYFKELGDEYIEDNNQEEASEKFKESIKWAMKSLYTAYANKNYKKMKIVYSNLDSSISALEQLDKINSENTADIRMCCDAYKLIINEYLTFD